MRTGWRMVRRVVVTIVGTVVLVAGVALLVLPGPGFLVIALGLLILALEYDWARRRAEAARDKAGDLARQAAGNRVSTAFSIVFALGMIGVGLTLGLVPSLPFASWWTGGTLIGSGLIVLATILVSLWQARHPDGDGGRGGSDRTDQAVAARPVDPAPGSADRRA